jgi:hypothetical protein
MAEMNLNSRFRRLGGYILIPHELLHVLGYRLVGQPCHYRWGESYITPPQSVSRNRKLVGMLLPFVSFLSLTIISGILSGFAIRGLIQEGQFFWFIFWLGLTHLAGFYMATTLGDLRQAYLLLTQKPWYSWTPFDFFFYPLVDWQDIRYRVAIGEIDAEQD